MRKYLSVLLFGVLLLSAGSCSFFVDDYGQTEQQYLSAAYKSSTADFTKYNTYTITDSILYVNSDTKERKSNELTASIINIVRSELNKNYTEVASDAIAPDLIVDLSFLVSTTTTIYPGYWWGWNDWYYWWDDWYTPFVPYYPYPMYPISTSYSAGSLIIEIADIDSHKNSLINEIPIVWHGLVRGILGESHTASDRELAIRQCFALIPLK